MALHRIEFTWFHYSRTVLAFCCTGPTPDCSGMAGVTRYAALWCPDFPPSTTVESDKAACFCKIRHKKIATSDEMAISVKFNFIRILVRQIFLER